MIILVIDIGGIKFVVVLIGVDGQICDCCELFMLVSQILEVLCDVLFVLVFLL